jgi:S-adenosylmethionine/arginine decarboxylase-like enzyme
MWGKHLIANVKGSLYGQSLVKNEDHIRNFCKTLVSRIDMKAYGNPILEHFAAHNPEAGGYTLLQLIETSNICAHFVDKNGDIYLDVFSCKDFDQETVKAVVDEFWKPESILTTILIRDAN